MRLHGPLHAVFVALLLAAVPIRTAMAEAPPVLDRIDPGTPARDFLASPEKHRELIELFALDQVLGGEMASRLDGQRIVAVDAVLAR